jgi:alpha-tubulin suppressor-like RCC1 family protein
MNSTNYYITSGDTITINSGNLSSYNISTDTSVWSWGETTEWSDSFPDWHRVQDMCKEYPGLEIALRNFQTIYTLVKDDYDNPKDKK